MKRKKEREEDRIAQRVVEAVLDGATLGELKGIGSQRMDELYAYAHHFYEQGRLDDAEKFFHFLCIYDFYNPHYWMGLAAVHQLKKDYQKAIDLYAVAFAQGTDDYRPMLHTGQCHLALGKAGKAKGCFEYVLECAREQGLRSQAQTYLQTLVQIERDQSEEEIA